MENIDKIRTKYMLFEGDEIPQSKDDVVAYLEIEANSLEENYRSILNAKRHDKATLFFYRILGSLGLPIENTEYYLLKDIEVLEKYEESVGIYEFLYQRLLASITDDNWFDIYRLGNFMGHQALETDNYYDHVLESVQISYQGIMCIAGGEDETLVFREFFDEQLNSIFSKEKVKSKKDDCYDSRRNDK